MCRCLPHYKTRMKITSANHNNTLISCTNCVPLCDQTMDVFPGASTLCVAVVPSLRQNRIATETMHTIDLFQRKVR